MVWLFVAGVVLWCFLQHQKLRELAAELVALKDEVRRLASDRSNGVAGASERSENPVAVPALPVEAAEPVEIALPVAAVVLTMSDVRLTPSPAEPVQRSFELQQASTSALTGRSVSDWLSENGLAWIGGGALALGGLMLVAYAAQHGVFTPLLRIWSAVLIGVIAIGVGERLRRVGSKQQLVAALTTAAGAAILYAAIWAAHVLYHFIPAPLAAILLVGVSLALLGLALLHGEALGLLAITAAYAVPIVSGGGSWDGGILDGFVLLVLATGISASGLRRWLRVGAFSLAGAGLWSLIRLFAHDSSGVFLIAISAPFFSLAATAYARRRLGFASTEPLDLLRPLLTAAILGASLLILMLCLPAAHSGYAAIGVAGVAAACVIGLYANLCADRLLAAPAVAIVLIALVSNIGQPAPGAIAWMVFGILAVACAGLAGALHPRRFSLPPLIGAGAAAAALTISARLLAHGFSGWHGAIDLSFAAMFGLGAVTLSRRSEDVRTDFALAAWIAASAEAVGLALHASLNGYLAPTAYGLLGVVLATLALSVKWRGFAESSVVAALASFAALMAPSEAGAAFSGTGSWPVIAAVAAGATVSQAIAWRLLKSRGEVVRSAEAASTIAILSGLFGCFLVLQRWTVPTAAEPPILDAFTSASLRTMFILTAALVLAFRGGDTPFSRWRVAGFLGIGAIHGLVCEGLVLNPWWGMAGPVIGPPLIDGPMIGLLAPALLMAVTASRLTGGMRGFAGPAIVAALLFFELWAITELRRLFHGPLLQIGALGYAEAAAYAVSFLVTAMALNAARARISAIVGGGADIRRVLLALDWIGLGIGGVTFLYVASPWWGPLDGELHSPILLGLLYAAACGSSAWIAVGARLSQRLLLARAALATAGAEAFTLITLIIRFAFHGPAMRAPLREASLETWTFSAVWALYGLATLAVGASRKDIALRGLGLALLLVTTAKVFLFDMARLEGVVRAASFLALGVVLLLGAFAARRLGRATDNAVRE